MATYTLRVYPKGMSRKASCVLECPGAMTLNDLAHSILYGFDFDSDHLYEFSMTGRLNDSFNYQVMPEDEYEPSCDVELDELGLSKGQNFWFHYDFGDDWVFVVHVNKVEGRDGGSARLISRKGSVEQYRSWDDEDEW